MRRWALKFGRDVVPRLKRERLSRGDLWHLDEVSIGRKTHWLWRARSPQKSSGRHGAALRRGGGTPPCALFSGTRKRSRCALVAWDAGDADAFDKVLRTGAGPRAVDEAQAIEFVTQTNPATCRRFASSSTGRPARMQPAFGTEAAHVERTTVFCLRSAGSCRPVRSRPCFLRNHSFLRNDTKLWKYILGPQPPVAD